MLNFKITSWAEPHVSPGCNQYCINVTCDRIANTIKSNYYKVSLANFWRQKNNATGVLVEYI